MNFQNIYILKKKNNLYLKYILFLYYSTKKNKKNLNKMRKLLF